MDPSDVKLKRNGGPNSMGPPATIEIITASQQKIKNLAAITGRTGTYALTVEAAGVKRQTGKPGDPSDDVTVTWVMEWRQGT